MAKPKIDLVVWASQDYILPNAHGINKVKPIDDLLKKGYDKGEAPAAEEFNYLLNMCTDYVRWVYEERMPTFEQEIIDLLNKFKTEILAELDKLRREMAQLEERVKAEIEALKQYLVPVGAVIQWHSVTPPAGWLECNGQGFDPSTYPKLYAALDNKNHVPDYRGYFPRGWAHGSAIDPDSGRALGSIQGDDNKRHNHTAPVERNWSSPLAGPETIPGYAWPGSPQHFQTNAGTSYSGGTESRPKNIATMFIIKTDIADAAGGTTPTGIVVNPDSITNVVGHTTKITSQVMPISIASQWPVSYSSVDPSVATVDAGGNVHLVGKGTTKIIAAISNGMMSSIDVKCYLGASSMTLTLPSPAVVDSSVTLTVSRTPADSDEPLTWESSNTGVLVVDGNGQVTGVSKGTATVTARGKFTGVTDSLNITVQAKEIPAIVEDIRLVSRGVLVTDGNMSEAPTGAVITGGNGNEGLQLGQMYYRYLQKRVGGTWYTVEYA